MRTLSAPKIALLQGRNRRTQSRVSVQNLDGDWKELTDLTSGRNYVTAVEWGDQIDQNVDTASVEVIRSSNRSWSLAPLREDSLLNQIGSGYSPLVDVGRPLKIEVAVTAAGATPISGDWATVFLGRIQSWDSSKATIPLECVGPGYDLQRQYVRTPTVYGVSPAGRPAEDVIQDILDDWAPGTTLITPVSPSFGIKKYRADRGKVFDTINAVAALFGWAVRFKWNEAEEEFKLTLYDPERERITVDWTFGAGRVIGYGQFQLSRDYVVNDLEVDFPNSATGLRAQVLGTDPDSITRFQNHWARIQLDDDSPINTSPEATNLLNFGLSDLAFPPVESQVEVPLFYPGEIGDRYTFSADDVIFSEDQTWAISSLRHRIDLNSARTTLGLRGTPAGQYLGWFKMIRDLARRDALANQIDVNPTLDEDDGQWNLYPNRRSGALAVYYTFSTNGSEPADPKGADEAGGPVGTLSTLDEIPFHVSSTDNELIWVKVIGVANEDGSGPVGPVRTVRSTFHLQGNRPAVSWYPFQPLDITKEGVRITAQDDSALVNVGYVVLNAGSPDPTWPGSFTTTGLVADPKSVDVEVTRPLSGQPDKLIYYQAEDADGNLAFIKPAVIRIDSNIIPDGWLDYLAPFEGVAASVIPNTGDADTGSWRFIVKKTIEGDDVFETLDPLDLSDSDPNQFSGASFGVPVYLDSSFILTEGEKLNITARFYRTTTATASAQAASIASSPVTIVIAPGVTAQPNALVIQHSEWSIVGVTVTLPYGIWANYKINVIPGRLVKSMHVRYRSVTPGGPWPWLEYDWDFAIDGITSLPIPELHVLRNNVDPTEYANLTVQSDLEIELTPYDDTGGASGLGTAGATENIKTGLASESLAGTLLEDSEANQQSTDIVKLGSRGLSMGTDPDTGRATIGKGFDAVAAGADPTASVVSTSIVNDLISRAYALGGGEVFLGGMILVDSVKMKYNVTIVGDGYGGGLKQAPNSYTVKDSGTFSGLNTLDTLNDPSKSWTPNEHFLRTVIILGGPLSGQMRRIVSNTDKQLVVGMESGVGSEPFPSVPGAVPYEIRLGTPLLTSDTDGDSYWGAHNLRLDGNKANQTSINDGIYVAGTYGGYGENWHSFRDVLIKDVSGCSFVVGGKVGQIPVGPGTGPRSSYCDNVISSHPARHSFITWPGGGTDWRFNHCESAGSGFSGFVMNNTAAKYSGPCKAFGAGEREILNQGSGFLVLEPWQQFDIYGQENWEHAAHLINLHGCIGRISGDANRLSTVHFYRSNDNLLDIVSRPGGGGLLYTTPWAVTISGPPVDTSSRNTIRVSAEPVHTSGTVQPELIGYDNDIQVNNRKLGRLFVQYGGDGTVVGDVNEYYSWGAAQIPSVQPYFSLTCDYTAPEQRSFLQAFDGTNVYRFLTFDVYRTKLVLAGDNVPLVEVPVGVTLSILGTLALPGSLSVGVAAPDITTAFGMFNIHGIDSSAASGPHVRITTSGDVYPLVQQLNWAHDNIAFSFDMYYDGSWKKSHTTPGFQFYKIGSEFTINFGGGAGGAGTAATVGPIIMFAPTVVDVKNGFLRITGSTNPKLVFVPSSGSASAASILQAVDALYFGNTIAGTQILQLNLDGQYLGPYNDTTMDLGSPTARFKRLYVYAGIISSAGGDFNGTVQSAVTNEAFRWGKVGMGTSGNPYYTLKHNNASPPVANIGSWDGAAGSSFLEMNHATQSVTLMPTGGTINIAGHMKWTVNNAYDIGEFSGNRPRHIFMSGAITINGNSQITGKLVSVTTNEGFTWQKAGAPAAGNPYYTLKHDNASPPIGSIQSWDGATAQTFLQFDHTNNLLNLAAGNIYIQGLPISFGPANSGGAGVRVMLVPN